MVYVIDTHALVWFVHGSEQLGHRAREVLRDQRETLVIPSIVLAEVRHLAARRRLLPSFEDVMAAVEGDRRCVVYPLDVDVVRMMPEELDIHDAIICGTALVYKQLLGEESAILTRDEAIGRWGLVPSLW